jgi:hypothetical protein
MFGINPPYASNSQDNQIRNPVKENLGKSKKKLDFMFFNPDRFSYHLAFQFPNFALDFGSFQRISFIVVLQGDIAGGIFDKAVGIGLVAIDVSTAPDQPKRFLPLVVVMVHLIIR